MCSGSGSQLGELKCGYHPLSVAEVWAAYVTSIYWHVGGRDKLFDSLVDWLLIRMADLPAEGETPLDRIASLARSQRKALIERQHLLAIAHQRSRKPLLFLPISRYWR